MSKVENHVWVGKNREQERERESCIFCEKDRKG